jgi:integrase/recombinase XerD
MQGAHAAQFSLYGRDGRRKYLTPNERERFLAAALAHPREQLSTFCLVLAYCGCRISEALGLRGSGIQTEDCFIAFQSLKKRGRLVVREVPVPEFLVARLRKVHPEALDDDRQLWSWSRSRAWRLVKSVMAAAGIAAGPHATPKGLRHAFGIHAIRSGVPLNMVQRWLGHASLTTTAIYTEAIGAEERELASRMWN